MNFEYWPGGLTVNIRDHSGYSSWCTYKADWYERTFFLPGNGTYPLVITPVIPENRMWDVRVDCGDGRLTLTQVYL